MRIIESEPRNRKYGVRFYADVESSTIPGKTYRVVYIRKTGMERFLCTCPRQMFIETSRRRNCEHIKLVRKAIGI